MTSNTIYYGTPLVPKTTARGYATVPGVDGHWLQYNRAVLPTSTTQIGWILHFKVNTTVGQTLPICGWSAGNGSLLIDSTNRLRMYVRKAAGQSIGNVPAIHPLPNLVPGRWFWVYCITDIPSGWCHYYYCLGADAYAWIYLGGAAGTFPGGPLIGTNSDVVLVGARGTTPYIPLNFDYFAEYVNGALSFDLDLRERDTLPAGWSVTGSAAFTPRVRKNYPPVFKDQYLGNQRVWPLRTGQPLTPDGIVDIHYGGTKVWPGTGEARWNVSQYNDGTKWAS